MTLLNDGNSQTEGEGARWLSSLTATQWMAQCGQWVQLATVRQINTRCMALLGALLTQAQRISKGVVISGQADAKDDYHRSSSSLCQPTTSTTRTFLMTVTNRQSCVFEVTMSGKRDVCWSVTKAFNRFDSRHQRCQDKVTSSRSSRKVHSWPTKTAAAS